MNLSVLPVRTAGAAENMAVDFLLLQRHPGPPQPRFRHYRWRGPAFTFGYSQRLAFVQETLAAELPTDLCRRPTGGGIVDHRDDWTYALVLPRGHPLEEERASESYRVVHAALAAALRAGGVPAEVKPACDPAPPEGGCGPAGVCFQRAERFDVVHGGSGAKLAGAAQKRSRHGLLFQGSIARAFVGPLDWDAFGTAFVAALGREIGAEPVATPWPEFQPEELEGLIEQYGSSEWLGHR